MTRLSTGDSKRQEEDALEYSGTSLNDPLAQVTTSFTTITLTGPFGGRYGEVLLKLCRKI